ncbi:hypothetical protein K466DRAFT_656500 [Polyporus arcularius HHB13444]|uniref:Uncharacterized protein n=1 Tax=Polyporus arcularius HHB13444 TaxID=1314778 RepID=A0A5C3NTB8_9APHY|nr:hypothetical protein K466DRAFT_656500 [Polyporus arcularius HHB13444]
MMHMLHFVSAAVLIGHSAATPFNSGWHSSAWGTSSQSGTLPHSSLTPNSTTTASEGIDPFFPIPTGLVNFTDPATPGVTTFLTAIPVTDIVEVSTDIPLSTPLSVSGSEVTALPVTFSTTFTALVPFLTVVTVDAGSTTTPPLSPSSTTSSDSTFSTVESSSSDSSVSISTTTTSVSESTTVDSTVTSTTTTASATMCPELLAIAITSEDPKPRAERRPEPPPCMSSSHVRNPFESPGYGIVGGGGRDWRMVQAGVLYMSGPTPPDILRVNADIEDVR